MRTMSNLEYGYMAKELGSQLSGKRLEKIYELADGKFRLAFGQLDITCELAKRLSLTKYIEKSPETPSGFAMSLRKYLDNARVNGISQHGTDRVLVFEFEKGGADYRLVFEMFGKGNILLLDATGKILQCYKRDESKGRQVRNGIQYSFPEASPFPQTPSPGELRAIVADQPVSSALSKLPLGSLYVREALARSGVDAKKKGSELTESELSAISSSLAEIVQKQAPACYLKDGKVAEFSLCELSSPPSEQPISPASLSAAVDDYYFQNRGETAPQASRELEEKLEKARKKLEKQKEHIAQLEKEAAECEKAGKFIYENFEKIEQLLELAKKGDEASLAKLGARLDKKEGKIELEL